MIHNSYFPLHNIAYPLRMQCKLLCRHRTRRPSTSCRDIHTIGKCQCFCLIQTSHRILIRRCHLACNGWTHMLCNVWSHTHKSHMRHHMLRTIHHHCRTQYHNHRRSRHLVSPRPSCCMKYSYRWSFRKLRNHPHNVCILQLFQQNRRHIHPCSSPLVGRLLCTRCNFRARRGT